MKKRKISGQRIRRAKNSTEKGKLDAEYAQVVSKKMSALMDVSTPRLSSNKPSHEVRCATHGFN